MFEKVFIPISELPIDPKSPIVVLRPSQKNCPASSVVYLDAMLMFRWKEPQRARRQFLIPLWADVFVSAMQDKGQIPPRMIMGISKVVAL